LPAALGRALRLGDKLVERVTRFAPASSSGAGGAWVRWRSARGPRTTDGWTCPPAVRRLDSYAVPSWIARILLPALGFGALVALLVTFVQYKRAEEGGDKKTERYKRHPSKPLAGGICAAALAGSIAAWRSISEVGPWLEQHAEIPLVAMALGGMAALAVAFLESKRDKEKNLFQSMWEEPLKPLFGGICTAALAGFSYAELDDSEVGRWADQHSIFTSTLTGVLLLGITVLVIDALVRLVASQPWEESLEDTWALVVRQARRGFYDLRPHLATGGSPVTVDSLPPREDSKGAYDAARELSIELGHSVGRASLAAFASDQPDLGHSMNRLSSAADRLQRVLFRYWRNQPTHRGWRREPEHVVEKWQAYVQSLCQVDGHGREHRFRSPARDARDLLENEIKEAHAIHILKKALGRYVGRASYEELIDVFTTVPPGSELIVRIETPRGIDYRVGTPEYFLAHDEGSANRRDVFLLSHEAETLGLGAMWCNPRFAFWLTPGEPLKVERYSHGLRIYAPDDRTITVAAWDAESVKASVEQIEIEDEEENDEQTWGSHR
jgi:hypothetical protein